MRYLIFFVACSIAAGCATARLDKLAAEATPYEPARFDKSLPQPVEVLDDYEVTNRVEIKTNVGTMVIGLYGKDAPITVANFLSYVKSGFYNGLIFHRVIPGFMIQGGGYDASMTKAETNEPIQLELIPGIRHVAGTISMARTSDPESATSQFFICVAETDQLNGEYAAFGIVEEGIDVATAISQVPTHSVETDVAVMDDVPVEPVVIQQMVLLKK